MAELHGTDNAHFILEENMALYVGISRSYLQNWDQARYGHFSTDRGSAILNPRPFFFCFLFLFKYFYVTAQFVAECRCARNVTLANLWIKCLSVETG